MKLKLLNTAFLISLIGTLISCNAVKNLRESKKEVITFHNGYHKFTYIDNQIILITTFSDSVERRLLLDLGAPISVIFIDSSLANLASSEKLKSISGHVISADGTKMKRENLHWGRINTSLFEIENSYMSSMERSDPFACKKLNGIWGANIFSPDFKGRRNKIIHIRMQDSTIAILDSLPEMSSWFKMNADFTMLSHIKVKSTIESYPTYLYFDTGFGGSILMSEGDFKEVKKSNYVSNDQKITYGYIMSYLSGSQIDTLYSNKFLVELENNITIDNATVLSAQSKILNAMGMEIISRYNILINYQRNELYLQPNPNYQPPPKTFFMCKGFKARNMNDNHILVINMEVNGPAEKAGLKVGDQILSINNIEADKGDNCEVVRLFGDIDGKSTQNDVVVKRNNEILKFKL
ncbi:MAG: PDZ domain-containing protein [Lentimicrobium sp.]